MRGFQGFCCAAALAICAGIQAQSSGPKPEDTTDVQHVEDAFYQAIHDHDGDRLAALFLPESIWLNILSDPTYASAQAKSPSATKIRVQSYKDFAKLVSTTRSDLHPTSTHRVVHSDGTIASVYFDFVFMTDGKPQNRGSESWQLVKGAEGWRIASLIYSSTPAQ